MKDLNELRGKISAKAQELNKLNEETTGQTWTAEHQAQYDAGMKEINALKAEIDRTQALLDQFKVENLEEGMKEAEEKFKAKKNPVMATYVKWMRDGDKGITAEEFKVIKNTMSTTTNSEGGYTVATEVANTVADALKGFGGVRSVATVINTATGAPMNFPTSDGTSETGEQLAENATSTNADISFGVVAIPTYKFSSKDVAVPIELLQDSSVDVEAFVNQRLVNRIGRITNNKLTTGSGSSTINGVVTAASAGKTGASGQTTTVIYADIVDLFFSVDYAYRESGNCAWMMNDATLKYIQKSMLDADNRPLLWAEAGSLSDAVKYQILGKPVIINNDMATMAASAKSILFGDFSRYIVRDALDIQMMRFTDSAYAKLGQVGFLMHARTGGNLVDVGGCIKYYINAAS